MQRVSFRQLKSIRSLKNFVYKEERRFWVLFGLVFWGKGRVLGFFVGSLLC